MTPIVKYKKLDARAVVPQYATPGAAAADLCAVLDTPLTLAPMQRALVPTGPCHRAARPRVRRPCLRPQRPVHQARSLHGERRRCH